MMDSPKKIDESNFLGSIYGLLIRVLRHVLINVLKWTFLVEKRIIFLDQLLNCI
jgi:hypothetical protein